MAFWRNLLPQSNLGKLAGVSISHLTSELSRLSPWAIPGGIAGNFDNGRNLELNFENFILFINCPSSKKYVVVWMIVPAIPDSTRISLGLSPAKDVIPNIPRYTLEDVDKMPILKD
jgi:hypothetical protein